MLRAAKTICVSRTCNAQVLCAVFQRLKLTAGAASRFDQQHDNHALGLSDITTHDLPLITSRKLTFMPPNGQSKQAWLETLTSVDDSKLGIVDLHPDIFATFPRIDILWYNIYWQKLYKFVDYRRMNNRAEMRGGGRRPWPQKGTGRARHGSIRSPLWIGGGKVFGPRGPKSYFFMLPRAMRVLGLRAALSVKFAQNDLHIVDSLDLPSDDSQYLKELVESRGWGLSVLFVNDADVISKNIAIATDQLKSYNVMPVYGLNVYSMLKHETLVLTMDALEQIEQRLLFEMHNINFREIPYRTTHRERNV